MEGRVVKNGKLAHTTIPLSIRRKFEKAMKMDAGALFRARVVWDYHDGKISMTIEPER